MAIEAELKVVVRQPAEVMAALDERARGVVEVYQDTYYDVPDGSLMAGDRELRVRTVHGPEKTRSILTYKEPRVDDASGSKPEHETEVSNPAAVHAMFRALGYEPRIAFEKHCRNYRFTAAGREMLATLVRVPELDGTFLEVETQADPDDLDAALTAVRAILTDLGITDQDLTTQQYTDAVAAQRR
ncbi:MULTISPECIES: class IV adenylate cyclase [Streptomycetaceae]|uniref:CYTH domain-containing protein n=1 Tax=Streptantibioticus cattleyicolor (strain ATCC 35852 / DSM 46488 / JCM 4925 / NBRC 14057 / NRRL 8057) TaxID=1003195 RepID=F8K0M2_STREN|nr:MULTISPECIES: class IV adenylate cyclase [Streptomycetaceae]AEW94522.1 hypothetical protein SCATT_21510 [Streptantibioticus cattleyicolor NRRL 8057 = DSM 46488]MYS59162.1 class IV adenylate cyclase [Streptomyces sp. SID5468]CCB74879.1 conserved protein of unknown function [Streptantibioticus cattleyicolor NRRL 8057 = DSM 46488]